MIFDPTYFDGEVREGFYVTPMMKRAWAASLEVLKAVEKICKKHGLIYFASHGTMLGAVRHKGYVPWDDDLDIAMSRRDINKFIKYAKEELPENYKVYTAEEDFKEFLIRVVNTDQLDISLRCMNRFHGFPFVAGIDIFIYDELPVDPEEEELYLALTSMAHNLAYWWNSDKYTEEQKEKKLAELEELCKYKIDREQSIRPQLLKLTHYLASCYQDDNATEVTMTYKVCKRREYRFPKEYIKEVMEVPFEYTTIYIPTHYHEMLTMQYGNYMTPKQTGASHLYPFYKSQMKILLDSMKESNSKLELPNYFWEEVKERELEYEDDINMHNNEE